jgi:O-antigen/teichoic acid export membrane protein
MLLFIILLYRQGSTVAGAFSLSIAFLTTAVMLSSIGMDELLVRETAIKPAHSRLYLVNSFVIRFILAVLGYAILFILVKFVFHYEPEVDRVILLMGLGILPEGFLAVIFAVFNGNKKLNWMALVSIFITIFQVGGGAVALLLGARLEILIIILLVGTSLGVVLGLVLFNRFAPSLHPSLSESEVVSKTRLDWAFCQELLRKTVPFSIIISITSLDAQIDVLLLSAFNNLAAVGIYSAARTIIQLLALLPAAVRMVIYPTLSHSYAHAREQVMEYYNKSWKYLTILGIPVCFGGMALSRQILTLAYRQNVSEPMVWAFSILMLDLLVNFLFIPGGRLMIVSNHQILLSILLGCSLVITVLLNIYLIPLLGLVGTSIARAAASWLYFIAGEYYVFRFVLPSNNGVRQVLKPFIAGIIMTLIVWSFKNSCLFMTIPIGILTYLLLILVLFWPSFKSWCKASLFINKKAQEK